MPRAIVRYSFSTKGVQSRKEIVDALKSAGFEKVGTATWEGDAANVAPLAKALRASLRVAANPPDGILDHLWIYLDNTVTGEET